MGACASVPKAMRGKDAAAAPAPEPAKEEIIPTADFAKPEVAPERKADDNMTPSLENLLVQGEASKEAPKVESDKSKAEVVSEPSAPATSKPEAAPKEDKKVETVEQK